MYDKFSVKDRVILLFGGAGILGREYVRLFCDAGAKLVFSDINSDAVASLERDIRGRHDGRCIGMRVDITKQDEVEAMFEKAIQAFGRVDVLINNAQGKTPGFYAPFEEFTMETLEAVLNVNLTSVVRCSQIACRHFLSTGRGGVVVNVASTYGVVGADQRIYEGVENIYYPDKPMCSPVAYAVSKGGVVQFTRWLASYYRERNIRVNCLTPGGVWDNQGDRFKHQYSARTLLGRMANQDEYNGAMLFLCSEASSYMTGANLIVDGGWTAT